MLQQDLSYPSLQADSLSAQWTQLYQSLKHYLYYFIGQCKIYGFPSQHKPCSLPYAKLNLQKRGFICLPLELFPKSTAIVLVCGLMKSRAFSCLVRKNILKGNLSLVASNTARNPAPLVLRGKCS